MTMRYKRQESCAVARKSSDAACYLPRPYSTWNFWMIPLEQTGFYFLPDSKG